MIEEYKHIFSYRFRQALVRLIEHQIATYFQDNGGLYRSLKSTVSIRIDNKEVAVAIEQVDSSLEFMLVTHDYRVITPSLQSLEAGIVSTPTPESIADSVLKYARKILENPKPKKSSGRGFDLGIRQGF